MTNLEWLYSLDPNELKRWFDSDRVTCRECRFMDGGFCYAGGTDEMRVMRRVDGAGFCAWGEHKVVSE